MILLTLFLFLFQSTKPPVCEVVPIAFMQHSVVEPSGQQQFWSVVQNCTDKPIKFRYTVTLLRESKPVRVIESKSLTVPVGEAVTSMTEFLADGISGNYTCVVTVTAPGSGGVSSADFVVR